MTNGNLLPTGSTTIDEQETKKSSQQTFDENSEPTNEQKSDEKRRETNSVKPEEILIESVIFPFSLFRLLDLDGKSAMCVSLDGVKMEK